MSRTYYPNKHPCRLVYFTADPHAIFSLILGSAHKNAIFLWLVHERPQPVRPVDERKSEVPCFSKAVLHWCLNKTKENTATDFWYLWKNMFCHCGVVKNDIFAVSGRILQLGWVCFFHSHDWIDEGLRADSARCSDCVWTGGKDPTWSSLTHELVKRARRPWLAWLDVRERIPADASGDRCGSQRDEAG